MVVIQLDPGDSQLMDFWRARNPEALAVVEVMELPAGGPATAFICQVRCSGGRQRLLGLLCDRLCETEPLAA
jgi:hypothetical protein